MAEWSTKYVNDLPDSAFLYVEAGGERDEGGKTKPRSLRHFPYQDANGKVDPAHAQNAIARIPQSNAPGLSADKKQALQDKARRLLGIDTKKADSMSDSNETIKKFHALISSVVGVQKRVQMTKSDFIVYATSELTKATQVSRAESNRIYTNLRDMSAVFKDNMTDDESESISVPVTYPDTTAVEEKQNQLLDASSIAGKEIDESAFSQGFVSKLNSMREAIDGIRKVAEEAGDKEETEKAKSKKVGEDSEEGNDATGHTIAPEEQEGVAAAQGKSKTEKATPVQKGVEVDADGTVWPSNLNDPNFKEGDTVRKSVEWGHDDERQ